jgi:iron-sulfur cluster repair protein YtfE (RIC family)
MTSLPRRSPSSPAIVEPMKRSEALARLSRDHHQGLFVALQLKRAEPETAANARQAFLKFFEREGARHFRVEEEVLLPAYARHGEPDQPTVVRVLVEHVDLRRRAQDLAGSSEPGPAQLHELGERLENHIRHEERVLFPMIEEALPMKELEQVAAAVERVDARRE